MSNAVSIFDNLEGQKHVSLASYRRNGQIVHTAIWFALHNGVLYARSMADAGKVKRIRNRSDVTVAICNAAGTLKGPEISGVARLLENNDRLVATANALLDEKYGEQRRQLARTMPTDARMIYIEVRPNND
jgi:PPOX class probable F420-dependent enzyme